MFGGATEMHCSAMGITATLPNRRHAELPLPRAPMARSDSTAIEELENIMSLGIWVDRTAAVGLIVIAAGLATTARARDYFLTIGGGYEPQGNQVSLERNVAFFSQILAEQRLRWTPARHLLRRWDR